MRIGRTIKTALWLTPLVAVMLASVPIANLSVEWRSAIQAIESATRDGVLPAEMNDEPLSLVEKAVVAAEFQETWGMHGIPCDALDVGRIARMLGVYGDRPRGMTLSQVVSKHVITQGMTFEGHMERHIQEVLIACRLDQLHTDEELLRIYLPNAYFGQRAYGLHGAAQAHFAKDESELTLDEAARLAVLLRAPNNYVNNPELWAERAQMIADRVVESDIRSE